MTKDEALKMAIEAFSRLDLWLAERNLGGLMPKEHEVLNACKEALEQPAKRNLYEEIKEGIEDLSKQRLAKEPVEVYGILDDGIYVSAEATEKGAIKLCEFMNKHDCNCTYKPLYTHPHQWQGLTDDEIVKISNQCDLNHVLGLIDFGRAIEQALKEKNT
jgi:hypothetical protein